MSFGVGVVRVCSLDTLPLSGPIGLLKINVEGAEVAVLRGSAKLIDAWLADIVVEAGQPGAFRAVADPLLGFGYVSCGRYAATQTYLFSAGD